MYLLALVRFENPGYLALLAVIPLLVALSVRSLSGLGRTRRVLAIIARSLVVLLMVLALAGAQRTKTVKDLSVIFLVDRSKSIPRDLQAEAFSFLKQARNSRRGDDRIGVIAFNGKADVEQLPDTTLLIDNLSIAADPDETNMAGAARLALALLPSDTSCRVVLISDGNENVGDILHEAQQYSAAGVPIDVLPVQYEYKNEVVFESLKAPPTATAEETVNLQVVLRSQQAAAGKILLRHNGSLVGRYPVTLQDGPNRFVIPIPMRAAGVHRFEAQFEPDQEAFDAIPDNNSGQAFTIVSGQGKVLILWTDDAPDAESAAANRDSAEILKRALETEKLVCEVELAGEQPLDQVRLLEYSAVVLSNVPANLLRDEEKLALAVYVRDLGGGLIMFGGNQSFGAGGWLDTKVEEVMPVSFDVKQKKQIMRGALVLVMHACEVEQGNYLGQRAAIEAAKTLTSRDLIGVLAWQWRPGGGGHWVTNKLQQVGDKTQVINLIKKMEMGDLPDLDPLMRDGVEELIKSGPGPKHMIVVSDFDPNPPGADLIETMKKNGITCSTIAIGYGGHMIDEGKARWISESTSGPGHFFRTSDPNKLPQIFIKESRLVQRSLVQEGLFTPALVNPLSPIVPGLAGEALPQLKGLVLTTPKPLADIPIIRKSEDGDDPVLAHWQVGLGKTVAFTSGWWPKWGPDWTPWAKFSKLWAQTVRWASRQAEAAAFDVTTSVHGGKAKLQIDAVDKNSAAINFIDIAGKLITPGQEVQELRLTQTGPGRYEAEFDAGERGNFVVNLMYGIGREKERTSGTLQTGVSVAYSPEYSQLKANVPLLDEVRARTKGRMLNASDAGAVFDRTGLLKAESRRSVWEDLVRWMLLLFLADVAIRRIAISPAELARKARRFLAEIAGRERPVAATEAVLTTLKGTRERVREEKLAAGAPPTESGTPPARGVRYEAPTAAQAAEDLSKALGGATQQDVPVVARPTGKKPVQTEADYTGRLLRAKRRAREEMEKTDGEEQGEDEKKE